MQESAEEMENGQISKGFQILDIINTIYQVDVFEEIKAKLKYFE